MSLDTGLSTPSGADLVSMGRQLSEVHIAIAEGCLPRTIIRNLHGHRRAAMELKYAWPLHARDSQLPPEGDWDTWMILAGRGFGKTRTGAEWVRAQVEDGAARRIALVARTLPEAQSIMVDLASPDSSMSALLGTSPPTNPPSASSPGPTERTPSPSQATNPTS